MNKDTKPQVNSSIDGKGEKEMIREQGASPQALAAVRAGQSLPQWGDYATTRFLRRHEVPFRMFVEVLRVEELLAARKPTIRDLAIEALEWLQHKGPVLPKSGICCNLNMIVQRLYPGKYEAADMMCSTVSGLCVGWRGLYNVSSVPISRVLATDPEFQDWTDEENSTAWEGVRGQLRRELVAYLLKRLKAGHMTSYTRWLDDSVKRVTE